MKVDMAPEERTRLARAWLQVQRNWWAWSDLERIVEAEPRTAFAILEELIEVAESDDLLGDIGAGPLEDFLKKHGALFVDEIEARAAGSMRWRAALGGAWLPAGDDATTARLARLGCMVLAARGDAGAGGG